ncbi:hypothetical protein [Caldibacillus debilis]|uniref:hypothetical protein n=1 Tax=Caldibacillus debilis TaxID=301148 RepID=UPI00036281D0|nr:hypothetical protein [Caldibacillus debilis]
MFEIRIIGTGTYYRSVKDEAKGIAADALRKTELVVKRIEGIREDSPPVQAVPFAERPEYQQRWKRSDVLSYIGAELYGMKVIMLTALPISRSTAHCI